MDEENRSGRGTRGIVRLADVAREADVAIATASRALSNPSRVNARTRARVLKAADRLGYATNIAARSLRSGQSRVVLVITPQWITLDVIALALSGVDQELVRSGYSMIVSTLAADRTFDPRLIGMARGGFVDGVLAITNDPTVDGRLPMLSAGLPSVGLLIDLSPFGVPSVVVAERDGTRLLTEHLLAQGRRRLMYVGGLPGYHDIERRAGFEDAIRTAPAGVSTVAVPGDFTAGGGLRAAEAFLAMEDRPDGVVLTSDWMAIAFMTAVRQAGLRIPQDVAVTGFDDVEFARYSEPPLTTYRQPMAEMGAEAARRLLHLIDDGAPFAGRTIFDGTLVIREST